MLGGQGHCRSFQWCGYRLTTLQIAPKSNNRLGNCVSFVQIYKSCTVYYIYCTVQYKVQFCQLLLAHGKLVAVASVHMCVSSSSRSTKPAPALLSSSRSQCMPCLSCRTPTIIIRTEGSITMNSRTVAEEIKRVWTSGRQSLARSRSQQVERSLWQQNRRNSRNTAEIVEIAQTVELPELAELGDEETATADARVETWAT